jgi:hypothetical protein
MGAAEGEQVGSDGHAAGMFPRSWQAGQWQC